MFSQAVRAATKLVTENGRLNAVNSSNLAIKKLILGQYHLIDYIFHLENTLAGEKYGSYLGGGSHLRGTLYLA